MLNLRSYRDFVYVDCWVISMASSCICAQKNDAPNSAGVLEFVGTAAAHAGLPGLWKISVVDSDIAQIWQLAMVAIMFFWGILWGLTPEYFQHWLLIVLGISCNCVSLFPNDDQLVDSVSSFSLANCSYSLVLCFVGVCSARMLQLQVEYLTIHAETSFSAYIYI